MVCCVFESIFQTMNSFSLEMPTSLLSGEIAASNPSIDISVFSVSKFSTLNCPAPSSPMAKYLLSDENAAASVESTGNLCTSFPDLVSQTRNDSPTTGSEIRVDHPEKTYCPSGENPIVAESWPI